MNLGLGSKRKRGKVVDTGYPTGLLIEKEKKAWWMVKGGGSGNDGYWGTTQMRMSRSRFPVLT